MNPFLTVLRERLRPHIPSTRPARTIDLRSRVWGNDYTYEPRNRGYEGSMAGWSTPRPDVGDYLLLRGEQVGTGTGPFGMIREYRSVRYQVVSVRYPGDPRDMWFAEVKFAPEETHV